MRTTFLRMQHGVALKSISVTFPARASSGALHSKPKLIRKLRHEPHNANWINSTRPGKHDQANLETIYVPEPVIKVLKPEIVTFEQAPGLMISQEHRLYFRGLIGAIVRCGYNVRYKIIDLVEYGVPQRRRRLIIIAARYAPSGFQSFVDKD